MSENLWPNDLFAESIVVPVTVLRQQAALLSDASRGMLYGEVETFVYTDEFAERQVRHSLYIKVPALQGYRVLLFWIEHVPDVAYPVYVGSEGLGEQMIKIGTVEELRQYIATLLTNQRTKTLLRTLIAQAGP